MAVVDKHLDYIQAVINRHNSNSFLIKGWAITIATAIFTLATNWKDPFMVLIAAFPTLIFWVLDAFFLANERCFVSLYNAAINENKMVVDLSGLTRKAASLAKGQAVEDEKGNKFVEIAVRQYSMDISVFKGIKRNCWNAAFFSNTLSAFYSLFFLIMILMFVFVSNKPKDNSSEPLKVRAFIEADSMFKGEPVMNEKFIFSDSVKVYDTLNR